ncbi:hypothetical protein [Hyphomonas sp.]|uniref:hypothetical protein n=1 Tax=Hyphomonas sp. TaxID=87 RepID=UPI0032EBC872
MSDHRTLAIRFFLATPFIVACSPGEVAPAPVPEIAEEAGESERTESAPSAGITALSASEIPDDVRAIVLAAVPDITIAGAQRKARDGRVYFDVEGELPDGSEIELDILDTEDGPEIVEVQRDIDWADIPALARDAAIAANADVAPVRVIESRQTDESIIYELFADGQPADPAMEVRVRDGVAEVLSERWPH